MDLPNVDKKLREAWFFLSKMAEQERCAFGDHEPFDFYLSAFLSATRSVDYRLRHEQRSLYTPWRAAWGKALPEPQAKLIKFLVDDRNIEVHESGSGRGEAAVSVRVGNHYSDPSGSLYTSVAPGSPPLVIYKPAYSFTIDGVEWEVVKACTTYLKILERMVAQFKADNP